MFKELSLPSMRNPSLTQIVTLTQILTPFLASRKCHYCEWTKYLSFFLYLQNILRSNSRNFLSANSTCWHDTFSWYDNNYILSLRKLMRVWSHINTLSEFILKLEIAWQLFDFTSASHKFYNLTTMTFSASYFVCYMTGLNWYGLPLAELTDEMIKSKKKL